MLIIDRAPDLPFAFEKQLLSWGEGSVVWRERSDGRGVARAVNVYSGQDIGYVYRVTVISLHKPWPSTSRWRMTVDLNKC